MDTTRKLLVGLLGLVLFVALLSANLTVAAERTVLDADYVTDTAEERDLYGALTDQLREQFGGNASAADGELPGDLSRADLLRSAVTEEYVQSQVESNVEGFYAYLHGDAAEPGLEIDVTPVKGNVMSELEAALADASLSEFPVPRGEAIEAAAASESTFAEDREAFRTEQKQRIQAETDRELSDEELEQRLDGAMPEIREELRGELETELADALGDDERAQRMEEPAGALLNARIDALTGAASYDEYASRVDAATADLREAFLATFEAELDEALPDSTSLTEGMDASAREGFETARTAVSVADLLSLAAPLLALVIVGLLAWLGTPSLAALEAGVVSALVGLLGLLGSTVGSGQVESAVAGGEMPGAMAEFLVGLVGGFFGALSGQSVGLLVVGVALIAVGVAIRRGMVLDGIE